jgi:N-acyl-D-aspartate/D-glutamate deacylase
MLTHWTKTMGVADVIHRMTHKQAQYLGLTDRGALQVGMRADINVIDPAQLQLGIPELKRDLPAGGKRFVQKASGYVGTWVAGHCVIRGGEMTDKKPGRLVRVG